MTIVDVNPEIIDDKLVVTVDINNERKQISINKYKLLDYLEEIGDITYYDDTTVYFSSFDLRTMYDSYFIPLYDTECSINSYLVTKLNPYFIHNYITTNL